MDDLVRPTAEIARTIGAVAKGDLGQAMELEVDGRVLKGEFLRSAKLVNTMVDQLNAFAGEVSRVAREVGTEGKLGGQAQVSGVGGTWKDLTDNVNFMALNLTEQVRETTESNREQDWLKTNVAKFTGMLQGQRALQTVSKMLLTELAPPIEATMRTEGLLSQSQQLTVQLQSRQSELQETNEQLGTKARLLAEQNAEVERKNAEVEQARFALEEKAAELALTSKYKSEFLANMSHELRTPLNSILILSQQLAGNVAGNLSPRQVEFSRNINSSGSDLLHLINDILDLSKIESGTVTVEVEEIPFIGLRENIERNFRHVAEAKNLPFLIVFDDNLPRSMESDAKRLQQILKNLLSNAVKFTTHGQVEIRVSLATEGWSSDHPVLRNAPQVLAFAVKDTGIGVAPDKQRLIFEAFQQADAGTSRKYGGTGLGLAISRELAILRRGEIRLASVHGQGSTFTLYLPLKFSGPDSMRTLPYSSKTADNNLGGNNLGHAFTVVPVSRDIQVEDDRERIVEGDAVLLIIEDDPHYARIVLGLARDRGFKGLVALKGGAGLALARQFRPAAISLDIFLPDMLGWTVLNQLKLDPVTRHIPVQIFSVAEDDRTHGLAHGAFSYVVKSSTSEGMEAALDRI